MELLYLCKKINLPEQAIALVESICCPKSEYTLMKDTFLQQKIDFFNLIFQTNNAPALFLYYYCRFACDAYDLYQKQNISKNIYWNTFEDITVWCKNCFRKTGEYGITQYDWLWRHVELKLFRLGRLQFEPIKAKTDLEARHFTVKRGSSLLNVHIPEGAPLDEEAFDNSFCKAMVFFGNTRCFICHSWLLYPGLKELLPPESNIIRFQNRFEVIQTDYETREAEERIFPQLKQYPEAYPVTTKLQDAARAYLMAGHKLGSGIGIFKG